MSSVITNIYNKENKGRTLMELFTATGKLNFFFTTRDVRCVHRGDTAHSTAGDTAHSTAGDTAHSTAGDTAHIDTIFKFSSG